MFSTYNLIRMEMYRSGHNGAHSKCVSPPGHEGSNPSISAFIYVHKRLLPVVDVLFVLTFKWLTLSFYHKKSPPLNSDDFNL